MNTLLLRNLGVNETIVEAIQKSYGDTVEELEIRQEKADLKLILRRSDPDDIKPHVLTIHSFFEKKTFSQIAESAVDYHVEKYNCRDRLEFLDAGNSKENLKINDVTLQLSDSLFRLLKCLAEGLVGDKRGWVYIQDLREKGIIRSDGYQPFSRLRSALGGYLLKRNPKEFIEANGLKQYRLSVNPGNIQFSDRNERAE